MSTWCDSSLAFQELLVREAIEALAKELELIEQGVRLTCDVNEETLMNATFDDDDDAYDSGLPQKVARFVEYLDQLRNGIAELRAIRRVQ